MVYIMKYYWINNNNEWFCFNELEVKRFGKSIEMIEGELPPDYGEGENVFDETFEERKAELLEELINEDRRIETDIRDLDEI